MGLPASKINLAAESGLERSDLGRADSLRYNVLNNVVEGNYDRAVRELQDFLNADFEHPNFRDRVERYIKHSIDLVHAIRAKRNFPGIQMLTMARQQELNEKYRSHFLELQYILQKVEKIQRDVRLNDVRSTVWVLKALSLSICLIVAMAFILDAHAGLVENVIHVFDDYFQEISSWLIKKF